MRWAELRRTWRRSGRAAQNHSRSSAQHPACSVLAPPAFGRTPWLWVQVRTPPQSPISARAAEEGRSQSTLTEPIAVWALILAMIVDSEADVPVRRIHEDGCVCQRGFRPFGSNYEGKNVPAEYEDVIRERLSRYDYRYHGIVTDENPNLRLLDDRPEVADYLVDRMTIIGTEAQVSRRIAKLLAEVPLAGLWLNAQEEEMVRRLATAVL